MVKNLSEATVPLRVAKIKKKTFPPASGSELARGCQDTDLCLGHGPPKTIAEGHGPTTCSGCAPRHLDLKKKKGINLLMIKSKIFTIRHTQSY
jgi:hypothetical protein